MIPTSKRLARFHTAPLSLALEFSLVDDNPRLIGKVNSRGDIEDDTIYKGIENSIEDSDFSRSVSI